MCPSTSSGQRADRARQSFDEASAETSPYERAKAVVLRQLTMAPRSRAQLEAKLARVGCPDDVAAAVLDRMTEVGLVDDQAYAQMLVRSQQASRGLAKRALAHELRGKGIDDDLVSEMLDAVDPEQERARAEQLVAKRLRALHGLDGQVQARRLSGMLARKGYSASVTYSVVQAALAGAREHQRD